MYESAANSKLMDFGSHDIEFKSLTGLLSSPLRISIIIESVYICIVNPIKHTRTQTTHTHTCMNVCVYSCKLLYMYAHT